MHLVATHLERSSVQSGAANASPDELAETTDLVGNGTAGLCKMHQLHHSTAATNAESCRPFFAAHQHPGPLMLSCAKYLSEEQ